MREAIGGLGLFQIVIFFLALFSGYLNIMVLKKVLLKKYKRI